MKKMTLFLFLMLPSLFAFSQRKCGLVEAIEHAKSIDPSVEDRLELNEQFTKNRIIEVIENRSYEGSIITIPVVVHVLYTNSSENISTAQIQSQIDVLNEDFRRTNSDQTNEWSAAADSQIEFCLAQTAPDGTATNGITRKATNVATWYSQQEYMKRNNTGGVNPWDVNNYMNIWLVPTILNGNNEDLLGYAYYPGANVAMDGVVVKTSAFGRTGYVSAPYNGGRTTTHEVGHYLNLIHIWGDGGCGVDDQVSDTPESDAYNDGCPSSHVSCGTPDMFQNYMDYTNDNCLNLFTQGQANRMRVQLLPGGIRASLGASQKCTPPTSTNDPCDIAVPFQGGQSYPANAYVINNGVLYQSNGAGGWTNLGTCANTGGGNSGGSDPCDTAVQFQSGQSYPANAYVINNGVLYQSNGAGGWTNHGTCANTGGGNSGGSDPCDTAVQFQSGQSYPANTYVINNGVLYQSNGAGGWTNHGTCSNSGSENTGGGVSCDGVQQYQGGVAYTNGALVVNNGTLYQSNGAGGWTNLGACPSGRMLTNLQNTIHIYPNPASSYLQITGVLDSSTSVRLYSATGQLVKQVTFQNGRIDLAGLSNGIYLLEINDGIQRTTKKFIKQ